MVGADLIKLDWLWMERVCTLWYHSFHYIRFLVGVGLDVRGGVHMVHHLIFVIVVLEDI